MSVLKPSQSTPQALFEFTQGLDVDTHLAPFEVRVQIAWIQALKRGGYLKAADAKTAEDVLNQALHDMQNETFAWKIEDEDIHMNLERVLTEHAGDLGKKIHLGRSRNDLIATTLRLWVADNLKNTQTALQNVMTALIALAENHLEIIIPGLTHVQNGQPLRLSQIFLAHVQAFLRDRTRLSHAENACLSALPLGAAAFAGTHLSLDFEALKSDLGFLHCCQNGYDAVGDRDFLIESLQAYALIATHLSRLCEEFLFYSSSAVTLFVLPKHWSTGSSIMPNKRNPDVLELIRAKTARISNCAAEANQIVRAVIPSYGSDLHELKRTFLLAQTELSACLGVLDPFLKELTVDPKRARDLLGKGHILATDLANLFVDNGMTFREAYQKTAQHVAEAQSSGQEVHEMAKIALDFESAVENRSSPGGTAKAQILAQIATLKLRIYESH